MELELFIDVLCHLACWLFGNIVSMFPKLPAYDSAYRGATLPKTIWPRTETMTGTDNELNLAWRKMEMTMLHNNVEVVGSIHTLCNVVESSFLLLPSAHKNASFCEQSR